MLTVDQKPLLAALSIAARASDGRSGIPILSCLRLAAKDGRMLILGTNLDLWVEVECEAQGELATVCPSAQRLLAAVKAAGPGELRIEERPTGLFVRHAAGKALLPLLKADEFPTGRQPEGGCSIRVTAAEWARAVALIEPSISTEASRFYLCGASLRANRGRLLLAATAPLLPQYLAIGSTMVAVDLVVMGAYTGMAARLLRWLRTPRQQTVLNRTFSGLFATAAVVLSFVRRGAAA